MAGSEITNTFNTYDAKGLREDLTDIIWNVSPTETPFATSIAKAKATNVLHEWQTDALAAASVANKYVQGDDVDTAGFDAVVATTRLGNRTQISRKTLIISDTEEVALKAGRKSEVAYQIAKKGRELRRDIEAILLNNQAAVASSGGTAPTTAAVLSWIYTNIDKAGNGGNPTGDGTDARSDGTQRTFTEAMLKSVLQLVFTNSGDEPDMLLLPPHLKQLASAFAGNSTRYVDVANKRLVTGIDIYSSDFGDLKVVPDRFMRTRDALVINSDLWALAWYRPIKLVDLAKTGDAVKKMIVAEYSLEARNEKGNGGCFDLTA